jgi:hypothetical protein
MQSALIAANYSPYLKSSTSESRPGEGLVRPSSLWPGSSYVPGFCYTFANGINDNGQIVGFVGYPAAPEMAFVATPVATPEPPSLLTLATCLIALGAIACCHRARAGVDPKVYRP